MIAAPTLRPAPTAASIDPPNDHHDAEQHERDRLAVDARGLGALLGGISEKTVRRMNITGKLPRPIRCGRRVLFVLDGPTGIRAWLAAGAPDRRTWETMHKVH